MVVETIERHIKYSGCDSTMRRLGVMIEHLEIAQKTTDGGTASVVGDVVDLLKSIQVEIENFKTTS